MSLWDFSSHSCAEVLHGNVNADSSAVAVRKWFRFTGCWSGPCLWKAGTLKLKYTRTQLIYCACNTCSCISQQNMKLMWAMNVRFCPRLIIHIRKKNVFSMSNKENWCWPFQTYTVSLTALRNCANPFSKLEHHNKPHTLRQEHALSTSSMYRQYPLG